MTSRSVELLSRMDHSFRTYEADNQLRIIQDYSSVVCEHLLGHLLDSVLADFHPPVRFSMLAHTNLIIAAQACRASSSYHWTFSAVLPSLTELLQFSVQPVVLLDEVRVAADAREGLKSSPERTPIQLQHEHLTHIHKCTHVRLSGENKRQSNKQIESLLQTVEIGFTMRATFLCTHGHTAQVIYRCSHRLRYRVSVVILQRRKWNGKKINRQLGFILHRIDSSKLHTVNES